MHDFYQCVKQLFLYEVNTNTFKYRYVKRYRDESKKCRTNINTNAKNT